MLGIHRNQMIPASLFSEVVPFIIKPGNDLYHSIPYNRSCIEHNTGFCNLRYRVITNDNWKRLLTEGTVVYVPLSCTSIHHKLIDSYGHDRVLELTFGRSTPMANGSTQLTFHTKRGTQIRETYPNIACRANGLNDYPYKTYVRITDEERRRDRMRFQMIKWRKCVHNETDQILWEEITKDNITKRHSDYLRMKVRRLIAKTREEHAFNKIHKIAIDYKSKIEKVIE
jgi:hypothetical protein